MQTVTAPLLPHQQEEEVSTNALEKLREELELVGYLTSHDLQAPLRIIQSCCQTLNKHPALASDAAGRDAVQTLNQEAARLKTLMQGLLDYIRLETFPTAHTPLDCNEIVAAAMATLENDIKMSGATVDCDPLPQVLGHHGRLTRLFAHLLDNALKFRSRQPLKVHISAQRAEDRWEFCVEDNGIGIDEEYQDIIFRLFQRLHTDEAYPGHGIGLALSRKIVEAHGGKLRMKSMPGKGSRFIFTLPAVT